MSWGRSAALVLAFEGIDGAGKSTLVAALAQQLQQAGRTTRVLHYGSLAQPDIKGGVSRRDSVTMQDLALLSYSRLLDWYRDEAQAAARDCEVLLLDRCKWTWLVRWASMGAELRVLKPLCAQRALLPDAHQTFHLRVQPLHALQRKRAQTQKPSLARRLPSARAGLGHEQEAYLAFQARAVQHYEALCAQARFGPVQPLDSAPGQDAVARQAIRSIRRLLRQRG